MLSWDEARHALGVPQMDATHQEFLALVAEVARADPEDFPQLFEVLADHTRDHFANETELMLACGFPAIAEHEGEHRRVLREMDRFLDGIFEGRASLARTYLRSGLSDWFANHLATMDAALAASLKRAQAHAPATCRHCA